VLPIDVSTLIAHWVLFFCLASGHCALIVALINRVNALGWERQWVKRTETLIKLIGIALPCLLIFGSWTPWTQWLSGETVPLPSSGLINTHAAICLTALAWWFPDWAHARLGLRRTQSQHRPEQSRRWTQDDWIQTPSELHWMLKLPGNEAMQLDVNQKRLAVPDLPFRWNGLRIGHLSDLHLTGKVPIEFYLMAFEKLQEHQPDCLVVSGDWIDNPLTLDWIPKILQGITAPMGCFFILGNHDLAMGESERLRADLRSIGWTDLGGSFLEMKQPQGVLQWLGDESPWWPAPSHPPNSRPLDALRVGVCHSPDSWKWARKQQCQLVLAGHTHGGQIRIPGIGPVISPSMHGSRFASGIFYHQNSCMHVSRGLAGKTPFRWRCPPEASLLRLEPLLQTVPVMELKTFEATSSSASVATA
jgi:predicted MPP superfamily phosphohydrolase